MINLTLYYQFKLCEKGVIYHGIKVGGLEFKPCLHSSCIKIINFTCWSPLIVGDFGFICAWKKEGGGGDNASICRILFLLLLAFVYAFLVVTE